MKFVVTAVLTCLQAVVAWAAESPMYNRDVRPILADKCFACHGPDAGHREADLRLDQRDSAIELRGDRPAILPGKPEDSETWRRIVTNDADLKMPPPHTGKSLTAEEIDTLRLWIAGGAEYQPHWAYVRPQKPKLAGGRHPIDELLARQFDEAKINPAPQADKLTSIRRLSFDLLGLPPTVSQATQFEIDHDAEAWTKLVDRQLDSPHYGERMAMMWFDLVRFADTVGYHGDQEHAVQPYRDYVIQSFAENKPFDVFTREQLAGDLLPNPTEAQRIATCYNRLLQTSHEGGVQVKEYLTKYESDRIRNLGGAWLGATLGCAECHDHKYDPITQRDFYRFAAIFADIDDLRSFKGGDTTPTKRDPEVVVQSPIEKVRAESLRKRQAVHEYQLMSAEFASRRSLDKTEQLAADWTAIQQELEPLEITYRCMVTESIEPRPIRIRTRGDWLDESGPLVDAGVPAWLSPRMVDGRRFNRLDLADWLTSADHPLTARVFVNRLWAMFFGAGLSRSLDDFGAQGEWPQHPELLDWLACEFVDSGWDVKHVVRLIVTSDAYRRSSLPTAELAACDPENRWFARQTAFRLPAEMIRDNALELSGLLVRRIGGAKAQPYQPDGYYQFLNFPKRSYRADADEQQYRRGVYVHWQRQFLHPMFRAFDAPMREECTARRPVSNTPLAALTLLNDPSFLEAARALAVQTLQQPGSAHDRLGWLWRHTLLRTPGSAELSSLQSVLQESQAEFAAHPQEAAQFLEIGLFRAPEGMDPAELAAWTTVCRVLLNLHETVTRD